MMRYFFEVDREDTCSFNAFGDVFSIVPDSKGEVREYELAMF